MKLKIEFQDKSQAQNKDYWLNQKNIAVLNQIHSNIVHIIEETNSRFDGDAIITTQQNLPIAVYTADCLPIVLYSKLEHKIALIHAGWQSTVKKIVYETLKHFNDINNTQAFLGPSARPCCYKIDPQFIDKINLSILDKNIIKQSLSNNSAFDLPKCNILQLLDCRILKENINIDYNICTICNIDQCSYRRDKQSDKRQLSIAMLQNNIL